MKTTNGLYAVSKDIWSIKMKTVWYKIQSELWTLQITINLYFKGKKNQYDFEIYDKKIYFKEKQSDISELHISYIPLDFMYGECDIKTLFNDMEYIGWCTDDEYQFYLKRATIELANYLSKYNRIKKDIQKDIILEFGI